MSPCPHTFASDNKRFLIWTRTWLLLVGKTSRADLAQREKSSQVWNGECGLGRAQLAKMSRALPEAETECLRMSWRRWSGLGLFKEGIRLYMWASFDLFFHSSNIYLSLYLSGFSRETCVCVCVCVCVHMYTQRNLVMETDESQDVQWCSSSLSLEARDPGRASVSVPFWRQEESSFSGLVSFFVLFRSSDDGGSLSTRGSAVCFTQSVDLDVNSSREHCHRHTENHV